MNTMPEELKNQLAAARLPDDGVTRTLPEALAKMAEVKSKIVADYLRKQEKPATKTRPFLYQHSLPELGLCTVWKMPRSSSRVHFVRMTENHATGEKLFWRSVRISKGEKGGLHIEWSRISESAFNLAITPDSAITDLAALYGSDPHRALHLAIARTRGKHETHEARMEAMNAMLEMHGIEALRGEWQNGYWGDVVATYLNTGDTYAPTVILRRGESRYDAPRYIVSSWGDFVESNPRLFPQ